MVSKSKESKIFGESGLPHSISNSFFPELNRQNTPENISKSETRQAEIFRIITEIHSILLRRSNLTARQKWNYCKRQRFLMKTYLKNLLEKL